MRALFGSKDFKSELKHYFNQKCQHPPGKVFCEDCTERPLSNEFLTNLHIQLYLDYSPEPNRAEMLMKNALLTLHPVFRRAFSKYKRGPDWEQIFCAYSQKEIWEVYIHDIDYFFELSSCQVFL